MTQAAQYALRAAVYLARHHAQPRVRVDEIAGALAMPRNYLSKVLHTLTQAGVLLSTRGPRGGFQLSGAPADITLAKVIEPFHHENGNSGCLLSGQPCKPEAACTAHGKWHTMSQELSLFFSETTLAMLAEAGSHPSENGGSYVDPRRAQ